MEHVYATNWILLSVGAAMVMGFYRTLNLIERIANTLTETQRLMFNEIKRQREKDHYYGPMV
jgi:hypothetical protein